MTATDWLLLLVRGGALGEAEEERARARYLYERGQQ